MEKVKHYGIWVPDVKNWMVFDNGVVFWTTSVEVAEAQLRTMRRSEFYDTVGIEWEVKEFK